MKVIMEMASMEMDRGIIVGVVVPILTAIIEICVRFHIGLVIRGFLKNKLIFSSRRIITDVEKLDKQVRKDISFRPDIIVGIGGGKYVGGAVISNFLASSKYLDKPAVVLELPRDENGIPRWDKCDEVISCSLPEKDSKDGDNILVVDDRSGTGKTLKGVLEKLKEKYKDESKNVVMKVAVIVANPHSCGELGNSFWKENKNKKEFYCYYTNKEVEFPWLA